MAHPWPLIISPLIFIIQFPQWLDDQDVTFINQKYLLGVGKTQDNGAILNLYNIHQVPNIAVEREYELPEQWKDAIISFGHNLAPTGDLPDSQSALFYPDPAVRVVLLSARPRTARQGVGNLPSPSPQQWLFINESFFRSPLRRARVSWATWSEHCLLRDIAPTLVPIRGPQVIGTKVVYLELDERYLNGRPAGQTSSSLQRSSAGS